MENCNTSLTHVTIAVAGGNSDVLVDDVSLALPHGTRTALIGRSGSGKSLIAAALTRRLPHSMALTGRVQAPRRAILIHQDSSDALNPIVRVGQQLSHTGAADEAIVDTLLQLGFEDPDAVSSCFPAELSGGQRQRLTIAMGLLAGAELIIADESTTALDPVNQQAVTEALNAVTDAAVLFITHDIALAAACCDRLYVLDAGRIVESGRLTDVVAHPSSHVTRALMTQARSRLAVSA